MNPEDTTQVNNFFKENENEKEEEKEQILIPKKKVRGISVYVRLRPLNVGV